jgi:hypothetical protein
MRAAATTEHGDADGKPARRGCATTLTFRYRRAMR